MDISRLPVVRSFDVFDTLITRTVGQPTSLFLLLGRQLLADGQTTLPPAEFARHRAEAERVAAARDGGVEATLAEIYIQLGRTLGLTGEISSRWAEHEMDLEERCLRSAPGAAAVVAQARAESPRLLFISDMYLPSSFIQKILEREKLWQPGDALYVSCEHGCAKRDGRLFSLLAQREGLRTTQILHTGDNGLGDVRGARRAGARAQHVTDCHLNAHENRLESFATETVGVSALLAGAGRLARLTRGDSTPRSDGLRMVTAGVAAPLLVSFVGWLLARAAERGLRRLYFVSRDGFVLKELAERMPHPGVELRYLYGSRQAWHVPAIGTLDARECGWIFEETARMSVRTVCSRVGCAPELLADLLAGQGFPAARWDEPLMVDDIARLRTAWQENEGVLARLRPVVAINRALTARYLRQAGLFDPEPWAMVDLGWSGRLQDSLARLLDPGSPPLLGFYFALKANAAPDGGAAGAKEAFLWDGRREPAFYIPDMFQVMESFCTAPHGSVTGYAEDGREVRAVFRDGMEKQLTAWGLPVVHDTLRTFAEALTLPALMTEDWRRCRPMAVEVLRTFACRPASAEAAAWGAFPYEDDQAGLHSEPLAAPLPLSLKILSRGVRDGFLTRPSAAAWIGGSKALTPQARLRLLQGASALGRVRRAVEARLRRPQSAS